MPDIFLVKQIKTARIGCVALPRTRFASFRVSYALKTSGINARPTAPPKGSLKTPPQSTQKNSLKTHNTFSGCLCLLHAYFTIQSIKNQFPTPRFYANRAFRRVTPFQQRFCQWVLNFRLNRPFQRTRPVNRVKARLRQHI